MADQVSIGNSMFYRPRSGGWREEWIKENPLDGKPVEVKANEEVVAPSKKPQDNTGKK